MLLALLLDREHKLQHCPWVASKMVTPEELRGSQHQGQEVCSSLELLRILPQDALPICKNTLTLSNNRIFMMGLND